MAECNCWQCQAERLFSAKRTRKMKPGKVYMYQLYNEHFEEFGTLEEAKAFQSYADKNIPYWDFDPVRIIDLNNPETVMKYRGMGWVEEE